MARLLNLKNITLGSLALLLLMFSVFPLGHLFLQSLTGSEGFSLEYYREVMLNSSNFKSLLNTIIMCLGVTLTTCLIGIPLGWLLVRTDLPGRDRLKSLFKLPYIIPPYLGAIAWIQLCNPKVGYLNELVDFMVGVRPFNIYSLFGLIWVLSLFLYSFILIGVMNSLENMDASLEESARMSGATKWQVFKDVTLPLIMPAVLSGSLLVFAAAAASFGVPALIGLPFRLYVLTTKIYSYTQSYGAGIQKAVALSSILMAVAFISMYINTWYMKKKNVTIVTGKSSRASLVELGSFKGPILLFVLLAFFVVMGLPFLTILGTSFLKNYGRGFSLDNFTLVQYYNVLLGQSKVLESLKNSAILAILAATISVVVGSLMAYIKVRTQLRGRNLLSIFSSIPYATPGVVLALGFILAFSGKFEINLYNTMAILLVAYCVKYLSFALSNTETSLEQVHGSLEEAAQTSGAGWGTILKTILVPMLRPTLIAGWFLIFMPTFSELTMSILLFGPETQTVGTVLYNLQAYEDPQAAAVLAVLVVSMLIMINYLVKYLTKGKYGF